MPWIQNCSLSDIIDGTHLNPGDKNVLIQIVDAPPFPAPLFPFQIIHTFSFLDLEEEDDYGEDQKITDGQAVDIIRCLQNALKDGANVIVHCTVGLCRSGAIAEVGIIMGFDDTFKCRIPNTLVIKKLMAARERGRIEHER